MVLVATEMEGDKENEWCCCRGWQCCLAAVLGLSETHFAATIYVDSGEPSKLHAVLQGIDSESVSVSLREYCHALWKTRHV